ncbi:MAG: hypothetical protein Q7U04_02660 [Bacteriovorax sp.]|nr:hypothetical protein [Bacteriovorax sp.]
MEVLKDQAAFGFTGKINLLLASNGQFQGVVYQHEGFIVGAHYGQLKGKKSLYKMIFEDVESAARFKFIVEPELIAPEFFSIKMSFDEVKFEAQGIYQKYIQARKLKPNASLRLVVDPEIIINSTEITSDEFDILSVLAEWCTVADIYKYSRLMEFEITNALVSLRKKRAIKVFQN